MTTSEQSDDRGPQPAELYTNSPERRAQSSCCGGPAPRTSGACCAVDAEIKATGGAGCGCAPAAKAATTGRRRCC
jgi:hypothetical protein